MVCRALRAKGYEMWSNFKYIHSRGNLYISIMSGGHLAVNGMRFSTFAAAFWPLPQHRWIFTLEMLWRRRMAHPGWDKQPQLEQEGSVWVTNVHAFHSRTNLTPSERGLVCLLPLSRAPTFISSLRAEQSGLHEKSDTYDVLSGDTFALFSFLFAITLIAFTYVWKTLS